MISRKGVVNEWCIKEGLVKPISNLLDDETGKEVVRCVNPGCQTSGASPKQPAYTGCDIDFR